MRSKILASALAVLAVTLAGCSGEDASPAAVAQCQKWAQVAGHSTSGSWYRECLDTQTIRLGSR